MACLLHFPRWLFQFGAVSRVFRGSVVFGRYLYLFFFALILFYYYFIFLSFHFLLRQNNALKWWWAHRWSENGQQNMAKGTPEWNEIENRYWRAPVVIFWTLWIIAVVSRSPQSLTRPFPNKSQQTFASWSVGNGRSIFFVSFFPFYFFRICLLNSKMTAERGARGESEWKKNRRQKRQYNNNDLTRLLVRPSQSQYGLVGWIVNSR